MNCKICGFVVEKKHFNNILYDYCQCCGFLSKNYEKPLADAEQIKRYLCHEIDARYYDYMRKLFVQVKPFLKGLDILDFGCGHEAVMSNIMVEHGYHVTSYDKYFNFCNYQEVCYDAIVILEVIEHLDDPLKELETLQKLLKSKGTIIIQTNLQIENLDDWWYLRDKTHISFFSLVTFQHLALNLNMQLNYQVIGNLIVLSAYN